MCIAVKTEVPQESRDKTAERFRQQHICSFAHSFVSKWVKPKLWCWGRDAFVRMGFIFHRVFPKKTPKKHPLNFKWNYPDAPFYCGLLECHGFYLSISNLAISLLSLSSSRLTSACRLISSQVFLTSMELLKNIAVGGGASSLQSVELQMSLEEMMEMEWQSLQFVFFVVFFKQQQQRKHSFPNLQLKLAAIWNVCRLPKSFLLSHLIRSIMK